MVYEKGSTKSFCSNVKDAGHQNHFHSFTTETGEKDTETIEKFLCKVEGNAAAAFKAIANREDLSTEYQEALVVFVCLMHSRVPQFRGDMGAMMEKSIQLLIDMQVTNKQAFYDMVKRYEKDTGESLGNPEIFRRQMAENIERIGVTEESTLPFIVSTMKLAPLLAQRNMRFICASKEHEFVTSDNPFIFYNMVHDPKNFYSGHGLAIPTTEIYFPLDASTALNLSFGPTKYPYAEAAPSTMAKINDLIVGWANKYVYSARERPDLFEVISKSKPGSVMAMRIS